MSLLKICAICIFTICTVQSARILGIFHMPGYSHFQLGDRIFKELAARGHEVTVITPYELKTPVKNLKHVVLTGFKDKFDDMTKLLYERTEIGVISQLVFAGIYGYQLTEDVLSHANVQAFLKSDQKFDLVIHELFMNDAFSGFASFYKAHSVIVSPLAASHYTDSLMGNSHNPSYMPDITLSYPQNMNLYQRTCNTLLYVLFELVKNLVIIPSQNYLLHKYFPDSPNLNELYYNVSLMLLNSHVSTHSPRPLLPNMIETGGHYFEPPKALPKDLQDYLDSAKEGVIYFSMGSNLKSKDMPAQKRDDILKALGKLKQKVLWKWEDDVLPGQPPNFKLAKWLPQKDILAHPNIKLFITHGGLLSTTEAIYHGVPILGLPVFGDQEMNIINAKSDGYGTGMLFTDLNEDNLSAALEEILNNPKYAEAVKRKSKIMHDQPEKPLDRAIYWIEYVLRHQGAPHLQSPALKLHWYQYMLLDVAAVIVLSVTITIYILRKLVKLLFRKKQLYVNKDKKQK